MTTNVKRMQSGKEITAKGNLSLHTFTVFECKTVQIGLSNFLYS
jgi:hypothetical protein